MTQHKGAPKRDLVSEHVRRGYLLRLESRLNRLRKLHLERNWNGLHLEITQLQTSAGSFGFEDLALVSGRLSERLKPLVSTKQPLDSESRNLLEQLMARIDTLLVERDMNRDTIL